MYSISDSLLHRNLNHVYATPSGSGSCGDIFNDIWVRWHNTIWCGEPETWWRMSSYWWITVYWAGFPLRWDGLWVKVTLFTCNPSNGSLGPDSDPTSSSCHGLELQPKSFWVKLQHVCAKRNFGYIYVQWIQEILWVNLWVVVITFTIQYHTTLKGGGTDGDLILCPTHVHSLVTESNSFLKQIANH